MSHHLARRSALHFRCIGPPRGGRVVATAGHPTERNTFYFGACAGGVWKSVDGGTYWENISDGQFSSASIGAIAVSEADPNVIYVGTGESTIRGDVSWGDGVYRSTDGGASWSHLGLEDTHHIGAVKIDPRNPDRAYVAALGHAFGPNEERGVFRTLDGGKSWEKILFVSDGAGAVDLSIDPTNPRILYATTWQVHRHFWELISGGEGSGLWKSSDGGDSWTEISRNPGLPQKGMLGKIGVSASAARPGRVWALIETEGDASGIYRSDDGGASWRHLTGNRDLMARPWYYMHIFADPKDPDTVYVNNLRMWKSIDGGKEWSEITTPHGDNHALWIDADDPQRMINGNDGGACVSFNGGDTWSTIYNQLTGQFYHMDLDTRFPYRVYGTQQDNSSIAVPSASEMGAIPWTDCYPAGTGESGYIAVNPDDPDIVFVGAVGSSPGGGGALQRYDHRTKQIRLVTVWPEITTGWGASAMKYRFPWTFPILFSPHDSGILYTCGNHVFRSQNEGGSWEIISPDLTRNDPEKLVASGGPLTLDTSGAEHYCTISAFIESPHESGVFWAGSDDGLVHISRDGGESWQNVTPDDLPEWSFITVLEPSTDDPATLYLAATRYKLDDYSPYLFKTENYGKSWKRIDDSFPQKEITRMLRVDPKVAGLLYVGSEHGLFVSFDDGKSWSAMPGDLPIAPIYDFQIKGDELAIATHGRAFWILDDLSPLREMAGGLGSIEDGKVTFSSPHLFAPRPTLRRWLPWSVGLYRGPGRNYSMAFGALITFREEKDEFGQVHRRMLDSGENPAQGVSIYYGLDGDEQDVTLTILDDEGNEIRTFGLQPNDEESTTTSEVKSVAALSGPDEESYLSRRVGLNRFIWDMRYPEPEKLPEDPVTGKSVTGALARPGSYRARLSVGDETFEQSFEIFADPGLDTSEEAFIAQFEMLQQINRKIDETHKAVKRLRRVRSQLKGWIEQLDHSGGDDEKRAATRARAQNLIESLNSVEQELVQTDAKTAFDRLRLPTRLNTKLVGLIPVVAGSDSAPTAQARDVFGKLSGEVDAQLDTLESILGEGIADFNAAFEDAAVPAVVV